MAIDVIEDHWFKERCQARHESYQCDDHHDHMGTHHHALEWNRIVLWPSESDIEEARADAEFDRLTPEQIMHTLTDGDPTKEAEVKEWAATSARFVQAGVQMQIQIKDLKAELAKVTADYHKLQATKEKPHG